MATERPIRATLDVEEAAARLGIGRTKAYEEVRATGALAGVPVIKVGRRYLIPTAALERLLSGDEPMYSLQQHAP